MNKNRALVGVLAFLSLSASAQDPSFEEIQKILADESIDSVEKFLEKLPAQYLESHTLVKSSDSLQDASPSHPRAIAFGKTGKLVMSFDHGGQGGGNRIEMMNWNEGEKRFEFRDIKFASTQAAHISSPNPTTCARCHASGPVGLMPRWDAYDSWPGLYGSKDDNLFTEMADFRTYTAHAKTHPRYKFLNRNRTHEAFPYHSKKSTSKDISYDKPGDRNFSTLPNTRLSAHLVDLGAQQVVQHIEKSGNSKMMSIFSTLDTDENCIAGFYELLQKKYPAAIAAPKKKKGTMIRALKIGLCKTFFARSFCFG